MDLYKVFTNFYKITDTAWFCFDGISLSNFMLFSVSHIYVVGFLLFFQSKGKKPLFVQFVLDNVWAVYEAIIKKR